MFKKMEKLILFSVLVVLGGEYILAKTTIDVALRLSEDICEHAKQFKASSKLSPLRSPLSKSSSLPNAQSDDGICWMWRWTKCADSATKFCSTWVKMRCSGQPAEDTRPYCETHQCGWTLDELFLNWGYNPEHVKRPRKEQKNIKDSVTIHSGKLLDFPGTPYEPNKLELED